MLSKYRLKKVAENMEYFYSMATDDDIKNGIEWYPKANKFCVDTANKYITNNSIVAGIVSALSPRNKWHKNLEDTITVLDAVANGVDADDVKVSTYHSNKYKAFDIANGMRDIEPESLKTYAFVQNVGYLNSDYITIDVWHMRACFDRMRVPKSLTPTIYAQIQDLTIELAREHNIKGYEYQAIIWTVIREQY